MSEPQTPVSLPRLNARAPSFSAKTITTPNARDREGFKYTGWHFSARTIAA